MDVAAFARGFLALIGANNRGQGIQQAADYIAPTIDVALQLGASARKVYVSTVDAVGAGSWETTITVPDGVMWRLLHANLSIGSATTTAWEITALQLLIRTPESNQLNGQGVVAVAAEGTFTSPTGRTRAYPYTPKAHTAWLNPGTVLAWQGAAGEEDVVLNASVVVEEFKQ